MNMDEARWERIERTIEYLTNQQAHSDAKFSAWSDKADGIIESLQQASNRHDGLIETLFAMQEKTQRIADQNTIAIRELRQGQQELTDSQRHTDERLNALIGFIDRKKG